MFTLMIVVFILGYAAIALEHPIKVDKAASALLTGVTLWVLLVFGADSIVPSLSGFWEYMHIQGFMPELTAEQFDAYIKTASLTEMWSSDTFSGFLSSSHAYEGSSSNALLDYLGHHSLLEHLSEIAQILFFLLAAMTIVEIVDQHQGFTVITDLIKTTHKVKLLWITGVLTFFMSSVLDNLTTTIVIIALLRKLIDDNQTRWFYASMVVIAANAGGAFSPIGDVTTTMLWIGKQIGTWDIIAGIFLPSLLNLIVPLIVLSFVMKGHVTRPVEIAEDNDNTITPGVRKLIFALGVGALLFVPVFKSVTHLPPYLGMLFGLGVMWVVTEIIHRGKEHDDKRKLSVVGILTRVDVPTVLFFLGILTAVAALQTGGHLAMASQALDSSVHNILGIGTVIGLLSAIVDNVPLVAGAMGMYPIATPDMVAAAADPAYMANFVADGDFWHLLAYTAGTGGSILIIGSAAGVAAMGLEKIDFIWYMKRISLWALLGYFAGIAVFYIETLFH